MRRAARVRGAASAAVLVGAVCAGTANATTPPPSPPSAIAQYQEAIPTSTGASAVSKALGHGRPTHLSSATAARVRRQGGSDANALLQIAASAPQTTKAHSAGAVTSTSSTVSHTTTHTMTTTARPRPTRPSARAAAAPAAPTTAAAGWFDKSSRDVLLSVGSLMFLALAGAVVARYRKRA